MTMMMMFWWLLYLSVDDLPIHDWNKNHVSIWQEKHRNQMKQETWYTWYKQILPVSMWGRRTHFKHSQWDFLLAAFTSCFDLIKNSRTGHDMRYKDHLRVKDLKTGITVWQSQLLNTMFCCVHLLHHNTLHNYETAHHKLIREKKNIKQSRLRSFCGAVATTATWLAHYNISDLSAPFFFFCKPNYKSLGGELIRRRLHRWHTSILIVCTFAQLHICMSGKLFPEV